MADLELRNKILKGAEELFLRYGMRSVSMDDIARHLGISKKTIYMAFADKDEIVFEVTRGHLERQEAEYKAITDGSKDSIDELVQFSICLKKNFTNMNPSLMFDLHKYHREAWDEWISYKQKSIRKSIADMIRRGITEGYMRAEIDPEIIAIFRIEQVEMVFDEQVFPHDKYNFTEVQMQLFDHFVHGLLTDKGKKHLQKNKLNNPQLSTSTI